MMFVFFFFQAEDGIRDVAVTGVQTCALPISDDEERGAPRNHRGEEELRQEQRALPEVAPLRLPEEEGAVARRRPGEDEGRERQEADDLARSEEHTSELQSRLHLVCRLLLEKKKRTSAILSGHPLAMAGMVWRR